MSSSDSEAEEVPGLMAAYPMQLTPQQLPQQQPPQQPQWPQWQVEQEPTPPQMQQWREQMLDFLAVTAEIQGTGMDTRQSGYRHRAIFLLGVVVFIFWQFPITMVLLTMFCYYVRVAV